MSEGPAPTHRGLHAGAGAPLLSRTHPATLAAFVWGLVASRQARRTAGRGLDHLRVPAPPRLPDGARRGVLAALRRTHASCLVEASVRQAWDRAHGRDRELVIGVRAPGSQDGFSAHAWLEGDPPCCSGGFTELTRR